MVQLYPAIIYMYICISYINYVDLTGFQRYNRVIRRVVSALAYYYSSDIVYRWTQVDPSVSGRKVQCEKVLFDIDKNDPDIVWESEYAGPLAIAESFKDQKDLLDWLKKEGLPPDGLEDSFNGEYDERLINEMWSELQRFRRIHQFYAALMAEDGLMGRDTGTIINEATYILFADYPTPGEVQAKVENLMQTDGLPGILPRNVRYLDLYLAKLVTGNKDMSYSRLCAELICSAWADILFDEGPLESCFGYKSRHKSTQNGDCSVVVNWWSIPEMSKYIWHLFERKFLHLRSNVWYYRSKALGYPPHLQPHMPGSLPGALTPNNRLNKAIPYGTVDQLIAWLLDVPPGNFDRFIEILQLAIDDILNERLKRSSFVVNSVTRAKSLQVNSLVDSFYIYISEQLISGIRWRKCDLCNRYFVFGSRANRRYCDVHSGPNAAYHRRKLYNKRHQIEMFHQTLEELIDKEKENESN